MRFLFYSESGEIADLAAYLQNVEERDVKLYIQDKDYKRIAEGIVPHIEEWWRFIGKGYIWVFDSCSFGDLQDWLREAGEAVVGGSKAADELENDRQAGQDWFKAAGFDQPVSKNFKDIDSVIEFVQEHPETRWVLKQNGSAPKSLSHLGKFPGGLDMIFHLQELKKGWNEHDYGEFDCDLMEVVEGLEVGATAFWNGKEFLKNSAGKIVGYLDFEEKKEADGQTGETCGETGTTFLGVTEDNELFSQILLRKGITDVLKTTEFRGVFNINCIVAEDGRLVALEPTCRFGIPASSYEFIEGLDSPTGDLLSALAHGINRTIEVYQGPGMVVCVVAKPFPLEVDVEEEGTSVGEKLWILNDGEPADDFTSEQRKHIHLWNFEKAEDQYKVPTRSGYLLTVTARGNLIANVREHLLRYIKENVYVPGMKFRQDIGSRVDEFEMDFLAMDKTA